MTDHNTRSIDRRIEACLDAGASPILAAVVAVNPHDVGVSKNLADEKVKRALDGAKNEQHARNRLTEMREYGGDYFHALWEGELAEALYRADGTNSKILMRTFSYEYMLAVLAADRGSVESARSWLDPNIERYGWPDQPRTVDES